MILTQSDTLRQWHQEFSGDDFLKLAKPYIQQITSQAVELWQQHSLKVATVCQKLGQTMSAR